MIEIEKIKMHNDLDKILITEHARIRLLERGITARDIIKGISSGEIIKHYEDDKPFPSCLILGQDEKEKPVHIVVSFDGDMLHLITAYYPNPKVWNDDFKTKKERDK